MKYVLLKPKEIKPLTDQIDAQRREATDLAREIEVLKYGEGGKGGRLKPKPKPKRKRIDRRL